MCKRLGAKLPEARAGCKVRVVSVCVGTTATATGTKAARALLEVATSAQSSGRIGSKRGLRGSAQTGQESQSWR